MPVGVGSYYTRAWLPHWEPGTDHGFTDGLGSSQQAFFLILLARLEINEVHL